MAITYGRGTWETSLAPQSAAGPSVPTGADRRLMLDPPYPNPAGDRVFFRFASRMAGTAHLAVFDVMGRRVDRVAMQDGADGIIRSVAFATDRLPPGIYFVKLQAAGRSLSRKFMIGR